MSTPGFYPDDDLSLGQTIRGFYAGQKVFNRYKMLRLLGRGGMGVVWLAQDEKLEQEVALKFLPEAVRLDPGAVEELKRETRRSLKLTHPNIVRTYDFVDDAAMAAIAMEYVDGSTLGALRVAKSEKVFAISELQPLVKQLCAALDHAHQEARIVHRDLKPANLMVTVQGRLKVMDFGIARSLNDSMSRVTMTAGTSGTMVYMSPQQLDGRPGQATDDVYALGATLYEMLAGRPPFFSGDIPHQIRNLMPLPISERRQELEIEAAAVPVEWEAAIMACLAKEPGKRPQSAGEVWNLLQPQANVPVVKPPPPVVAEPPPIQPAPPPVLPPPLVTPPVVKEMVVPKEPPRVAPPPFAREPVVAKDEVVAKESAVSKESPAVRETIVVNKPAVAKEPSAGKELTISEPEAKPKRRRSRLHAPLLFVTVLIEGFLIIGTVIAIQEDRDLASEWPVAVLPAIIFGILLALLIREGRRAAKLALKDEAPFAGGPPSTAGLLTADELAGQPERGRSPLTGLFLVLIVVIETGLVIRMADAADPGPFFMPIAVVFVILVVFLIIRGRRSTKS